MEQPPSVWTAHCGKGISALLSATRVGTCSLLAVRRADAIGQAIMAGRRKDGVLEREIQSIPRSKFGAPLVPGRALDRPRVFEALSGSEWRAALITGGPGTGKTVCTAQWFEGLGPALREWVTIDANDDRPERFWLIT